MSLPKRTPRLASSYQAATVIPAQPEDLDILSQVIADAFGDLPQSRWLIPDPDARHQVLPGYFRIYLQHAMDSGTVHTTTDRTAAALWLPVTHRPPSPPAGYDVQLTAITAPWTDRFRAFDTTLERHHPAGPPHHHLAILAVRPDRQRQGTGSQLLRAYHHELDRQGIPAYLEAADLRTRRLYLGHHYTDLTGAAFHLPDDGPPMWPMWREPRHPPDSASA